MLEEYLPYHALSRFIGVIANSKIPFIKNTFISWFMKRYQVNLSDAIIQDPKQYQNFNDFFTRKLLPNARPLAETAIVSPVDGSVYHFGEISDGKLFQAKNHYFSLTDLLAHDKASKTFEKGAYATLYLAPKNYHRIHMPIAGKLIKTIYVPGKLFSVQPKSTETIPNLFARNERLICLFETAIGEIAVIFVGACIVASIVTTWSGRVAPSAAKTIQITEYPNKPLFEKGAELGYFELGSTVILLFPQNSISFATNLTAGQPIQMGDGLAGRFG